MRYFEGFIRILVIALILNSSGFAMYKCETEKGWLWYREANPQSSHKPTLNTTNNSPSKKVQAIKKNFQQLLDKALIEPSMSNVLKVIAQQRLILEKSERFQKAWTLASMQDPQNYREAANPNNDHQRLYKERRAKILTAKLKYLAKTHGLVLLFSKDCSYCHRFAPIVKRFAKAFNFKLLGASPSGASIKGINMVGTLSPQALKILNPQGHYPLLFLFNPGRRSYTRVASGLISWSELLNNFMSIIQAIEERSYAT